MRFLACLMAMPIMLAACSKQANEATPTPTNASDPSPERTTEKAVPSFTSNIDGVRFSAIGTLPVHPGAPVKAACGEIIANPSSAAGRMARDAGWAVTGETTMGRYDIVSFVGGVEPSTSGTCVYSDGNIALFRDGAVKAIAYGVGQQPLAIGVISKRNGLLTIQDGDVLHETVGVLTIDADGSAIISRTPAKEQVCGGRSAVPNIQDLPINRARQQLTAAGWTPLRRAEPVRRDEDGRAYDLAQAGLTEVDGCSDTGMAYCTFEYRRAGARLSVVTEGDGEWPSVTRYDVTCGGGE